MMPPPSIESARLTDQPAIAQLLLDAGLPHTDIGEHLHHFFVARDASGNIVGAIGTEVYGAEALLRSLVVAPGWRRQNMGNALFLHLTHAGRAWGIRRFWLLTTTAAAFFERRGFALTPRNTAPHAIAQTREFRELCPCSAACLSRGEKIES